MFTWMVIVCSSSWSVSSAASEYKQKFKHNYIREIKPTCVLFFKIKASFLASQDAQEVILVTDWLTDPALAEFTDVTLASEDEVINCDVSPVAMFTL